MTKYAEAAEFIHFWGVSVPSDSEADVDDCLEKAASPINLALMSIGALNCTMSTEGHAFLNHLNILIGAIFYRCPCSPNLENNERTMYGEWINARLQELSDGRLEVCQGKTGSKFPSAAYTARTWTEWNEARIRWNSIRRDM